MVLSKKMALVLVFAMMISLLPIAPSAQNNVEAASASVVKGLYNPNSSVDINSSLTPIPISDPAIAAITTNYNMGMSCAGMMMCFNGTYAFKSAVYDGTHTWLIPYSATQILKLNSSTGQVVSSINSWPSGFYMQAYNFNDGVYDGTNIWLIPETANRIMRFNTSTNAITGFNAWPSGFSKTDNSFAGGVYDGTNVWLIPGTTDKLIKLNPTNGTMSIQSVTWPTGFATSGGSKRFNGGTFDGTYIWMYPDKGNMLVRYNPATNEMVGFAAWPANFTKHSSIAFVAAIYDGTDIWLVPSATTTANPNYGIIIKVNRETGAMTGFNNWPGGFSVGNPVFNDAVFDGENIWLISNIDDQFVRFNLTTETMSGFKQFPSGVTLAQQPFGGAVYTGGGLLVFPFNQQNQSFLMKNGVTVTFETDGGSSVATQTIFAGAKATQPANPTKAGSAFIGWFSDAELTTPFNFNNEVNANTTIYAKWEVNVAPTDISLSANTIAENGFPGQVIGILTATDANASDVITFSLASGEGDTDNSKFAIDKLSNNWRLKTNVAFDYETNSQHSIRMRATDSGGNTYDEMITIQVTDVDDTAPSVPSNLSASNVTANSFTLNWTPSTDNVGVSYYEVYRGTTYLGGTFTNAYNVTGLQSGQTVNMTVRAVDAKSNKSAASTALPVTTLDNVAPSVPNGLTVSNIGAREFQVRWSASTDNVGVKNYNIYRNNSYVATVTSTAYSFTGLTPSSSHSVAVQAIDAAGNRSTRSTAVSATTLNLVDNTPPSVPSNIQTTNIFSNRLLLTWTASTDDAAVQGYNVYLNNVLVRTVINPAVELTGLTQYTQYTIDVQAVDTAKNRSARSAAFVVRTADGLSPTTPIFLSSSNITRTGFRVSWWASIDNVGVRAYNIYRNGVYAGTANNTSFTFADLPINQTHHIRVEAVDAAGNKSALSSQISVATTFTSDAINPSAPTNVAASNITKTGFRVTWTAATDNVGVTAYNVYRGSTYIATVSGTTTGYNFIGLTAGTNYSITVRALDAQKNFANSSPLSVTTLP